MRPAIVFLGLCSALVMLPTFAQASSGLCIDLNAKNWLLNNERIDGAHTKKCHIDPKEADLIKRVQSGIQGCKRVSVASAFRNQSVAQTVIRSTLVQNTREVKAWFRKAKVGQKKSFKHKPRQKRAAGLSVTQKTELTAKQGRACRNRTYICDDAKRVTVVLKKIDAQKCFILTAYPSE